MADRILIWYLPEVTGDGTNQGNAFYLDQDYALPASVRIYAHRAPDDGDLLIDIKDDGESIFGTRSSRAITPRSNYSEIDYDTLAVSTFSVKELISGGTSSASAEIMSIDGSNLTLRIANGLDFSVGETITGQTNSATAVVRRFLKGNTNPSFQTSQVANYATLSKNESGESEAEHFADNKTYMDKGSWVTLDVVQSGGAKRITVQMELESLD